MSLNDFSRNMPDAEQVVIGWLSSQPEMAGVTVSSRVPVDFDGTQKIVRVFRTGGFMENKFPALIDHARFDVDCFGPTKADAYDLTAAVRRLVLWDIRYADVSAYNASIFHSLEYVGPQWFDEPDYPNAGRYLIQVGLSLKPV